MQTRYSSYPGIKFDVGLEKSRSGLMLPNVNLVFASLTTCHFCFADSRATYALSGSKNSSDRRKGVSSLSQENW